MKIAYMVHLDLPKDIRDAMEEKLKNCASPGTDVDVFCIDNKRMGVAGDIDLTIPAVTDLAVKLEQSHYDAIILGAT
jgi:hypothetical protein